MNDDYASILDLEFAETPEAFAEALKRFLRRFEGLARRKNLRRPTQESLEGLTKLVNQYGVKLVRAALISHALVKGEQDSEGEVSGQLEPQGSQDPTENPSKGGNQP